VRLLFGLRMAKATAWPVRRLRFFGLLPQPDRRPQTASATAPGAYATPHSRLTCTRTREPAPGRLADGVWADLEIMDLYFETPALPEKAPCYARTAPSASRASKATVRINRYRPGLLLWAIFSWFRW